MSIVYVEGSLSPGALVCVLPSTNGDLDFVNMILVAIPRNKSDNFTIPVPSGEYSVVVFDLEHENGTLPRVPFSQAADFGNIMVTSYIEGMLRTLFKQVLNLAILARTTKNAKINIH